MPTTSFEFDVASSPSDFIDHIVGTHHAYTRDALQQLVPLANKVAGVHANHPEAGAARDLIVELADELLPHLDREEMILFPYIRTLELDSPPRPPFGTVANPLRVMARDHERANELLEELRRVTGGYVAPPHACGSWRRLWSNLQELDVDLVAHIELEDGTLFSWALEREQQLFNSTQG
jgi:regulator of cell morphogenesis and NO signaling